MRNSQKFFIKRGDVIVRSFDTASEMWEYLKAVPVSYPEIHDNFGNEMSGRAFFESLDLAANEPANRVPLLSYNEDGTIYAFTTFDDEPHYNYRGRPHKKAA